MIRSKYIIRMLSAVVALLLTLWLSLFATQVHAQEISYTIETDRNTGTKNDLFTITITLQYPDDDDLEKIQLPDFSKFEQIDHGSSKQMSLSIINGRRSASETRIETFVLRPKSSGTLSIENGYIQYDRKIFKSNSIEVRVLDGSTASQNQNTSNESSEPNIITGPDPSETKLFVRYKLSRNEVYVGEQISLEVWLFTREGLEIQDLKIPKGDGFWLETIKLQKSEQMAQNATVGGIPYNAYLLSRQILFPLEAKTYHIEPSIVEAVTGGSFFSIGRKIIRQTQPIEIIAKELPLPFPNDFHPSNVGQYSIKAEVNKSHTNQGDPITLRIIIEGNGNFKNIQLNQKPVINNWKIYDPTITTMGDFVQGLLFGKKTFEYLIVPQNSGAYHVGPFHITYFDPTNNKYETAQTQPIMVQVSASQELSTDTHHLQKEVSKNTLLPESRFRPLYVGALITNSVTENVPESWIALLSVSPLLSVSLIMITLLFRLRSHPEKSARQKVLKNILRSLQETESLQASLSHSKSNIPNNATPQLFLKMQQIAIELLEFHFGSQVRSATHKDIAELLQGHIVSSANGFSSDIIKQVIDLLQQSDIARFAPSSVSSEKSKEHIQTLYHLYKIAKHHKDI